MAVESIAPTGIDDIISASKPTLLIFTQARCAPCRAMTPIIESLSADDVLSRTVRIVRVPMERRRRADEAVFENKYDVEGYPTLQLYKDGELISTKYGYCEENTITEFIRSKLK